MPELDALVVCPVCRGGLERLEVVLRCQKCLRTFEVRDRIPLLFGSGDSKAGQSHFFDEQVDEEFEIARPHGTPALHGWLLAEKFRRSVAGLGELLPGATVLDVCAGSGMDADFLARAGARVIAADLSFGAARRAQQRADRLGLAIWPLVANAERLPFPDRSVDVVYVHDGLHHLVDPLVGLAEMARVARFAVSITEPAEAAITRLAVRLGIAEDVEIAGNRVARLTAAQLRTALRSCGFEVVHLERYGMFYRHAPKAPVRLLSRRRARRLAQTVFLSGNRIAGRWGNKLTAQAVRAE